MNVTQQHSRVHAGERDVTASHAVWCLLAALVVGVETMFGDASPAAMGVFAVLALLPAGLAFALRARFGGDDARLVLYAAWAGAGASALAIADNNAWSFMAWAVAPVAASLLFGERRLTLAAVAFGAGAMAIAALLKAAGMFGDPRAGVDFGILPIASAVAVACFVGFAAFSAARADRARLAGARWSTAKTRALLDSLPFAVLRIGADGVAVDVDGAVEAVLSTQRARALNMRAADFIDARYRTRFESVLDDVLRYREPATLRSEAGGVTLELHISPRGVDEALLVAAIAPHPSDALALLRDERDAALAKGVAQSTFFASLSHELRTPLNAIIGFSETMDQRMFGPLPEKYGEYVSIIHETAEHLRDLISSILDFSKIEGGHYEFEREDVAAREAVESAIRLTSSLAQAKHLVVVGDIAPNAETISADERAVKQILLNLLSNAIKFTPEGGRIDVRVRRDGARQLIEVTDTGCGISDEEVVRIGTPFAQTESGKQSAQAGTGLGLAIVRGLAELHGGGLEVESTVGRGTTMRAVLMLDDGAPEDDADGVTSLDARARLERVRQVNWNAS